MTTSLSTSPAASTPVFIPRRKADPSLDQLPALSIGESILIPSRDRNNAYKHAQLLGVKIAARIETDTHDRIWRVG
jgi:hypothetical protein